MRNTSLLTNVIVASIAGALLLSAPAHAGSISIMGDSGQSTEGLGSFTGIITYTTESDMFGTVGTLTIMLTNTSDPANGGYITGFLFNIASSDENASATLMDDPAPTHPFAQCEGNGLSGVPFGNPYDSGAALGGAFLGAGDPTPGIAVGDSGTFTFLVEADDAGSLSPIDFIMGGPFEHDFIVRFRGFDDGGSDKVPAVLIPLPAPFALGAAGLFGVMLVGRRIRRRLGTN
jgi:hypothetical protein